MNHKYRSLLIIALLLLAFNTAQAQFYGVPGRSTAAIFLPGHYLELGVNANGAFGAGDSVTGSVPFTGYYPYLGAFYSNPPLAEVYDFGHDGWSVGTPNFYGDYTYPGSPFEGWELQVGGAGNVGQAYTTGSSFNTIALSGSSTLNGGLTSYVNAGGQLVANWAGTESGGNLLVNMSAEVDSNGNTYNCVVTLKNIGATPITGVYYMRSCDPDNDEAHGGSFATNNTIVHQNENASHDVEVDAEGTLYDDHWSICTKDCRATAFVYTSWPLSSAVDLAAVSAETSDCSGYFGGDTAYALGSTLDGDYAIGVVFNIGTIPAGDSAVVAYAYVFNDAYSTIDVAFPDPTLVVNGNTVPNDSLPNPTVDSFDACAIPGLVSFPVSIINGSSGAWSWAQWNWSPATGLASTTGVTNTINTAALPPYITYTIVGTDTSAGSGMSCNQKTFYLTIHSCNCIPERVASFTDDIHLACGTGDSVFFNNESAPPGTFTSYWLFTDGSAEDSTDTNPVHIFPDGSTGIGTYTVTLVYGSNDAYAYCNDTVSTVINFDHPLTAAFTVTPDTICLGVPLTFNNSSVANSPSYLWNYGDGTTDTAKNPTHTFGTGGVYNVALMVVDNTPCVAYAYQPVDVIAVDVQTGVHDTSVCLPDSMSLRALTTLQGAVDGLQYSWSPTTGLGEPNDSVTKFFGVGTYQYTVTVSSIPLGCSASDTETVNSYPPVTLTGVTASTSILSGTSIDLNASGATLYTWVPNDGTLSNPNINDPVATPVDSITTYTVYGMSPYGCLDSASVTVTLTYGRPEFVPSAFTPNHDGLNDVLKVGNMSESKLVDFKVFNRWGQVIFQTNDVNTGWDGTFNGVPQDLGVYNYIITISHSDGTPETITGNVTLIR